MSTAPHHRRRAARLLPAALMGLALTAAAGCETQNELEGSLTEVYGIRHQSVRVRLTTSELAIEYVGSRDSVPVRATIDLDSLAEDVELSEGTYDLPEHGYIGGRLANETELPPLINGSVRLQRFNPVAGSRVIGRIRGKFDAGRDELGIAGEFNERLELLLDLGEPPPPPPPDGGVVDGGDAVDAGGM